MDVLLYLTELLQTRKNIGIEGLGSFYKKKSPGSYDAVKHVFLPPSYTIAFKTNATQDEDLANYISDKRNITVESANYYIAEFVENIHAQLAKGDIADIGELGKLVRKNDELVFTCSQDKTYGFEYYGLPEVKETSLQKDNDISSPLEQNQGKLEDIIEENKLEEENPGEEILLENVQTEQELFQQVIDSDDSKTSTTVFTEEYPVIVEVEEKHLEEPINNVILVDQVPVEEEVEKKGMPFFMKLFIGVLIMIALAAIVYFVNPPYFDNYFNKNSTNKNQLPAKNIATDSLPNKGDSIQRDSLSNSNAMITLRKDTIVTIDSSKLTIYEVIGTAESSQASANAYIARVAKKGITAKPIKLSKRLINISLGTFLNQDEALKYQDSLRILFKNPDIYVKTYKPKK